MKPEIFPLILPLLVGSEIYVRGVYTSSSGSVDTGRRDGPLPGLGLSRSIRPTLRLRIIGMKRYLAALAGIALLAGCSSSVEMVSADQVSKFTPGKTNETEVVALLGKPLETVVEADGTKIEQYPSSIGASGGSSIIPDWLGGSSAASYRMVSFNYGSGGVLKSIGGAGDVAAK